MVMHYINDACATFAEGSKMKDRAKKEQNCTILDDGIVHTTKKLPPNREFYTG